MFSIYTSAFNVNRMNFDFKSALDSFSPFADEVVVAVNTSSDQSYDSIKEYADDNVRVIQTDFKYDDPDLDGKIKNAALQETTNEIKIGLDLDEYIPLWQKPMWEMYAQQLLKYDEIDAFMIPVVNLFGDTLHFSDIGQKWYMHKAGCFRGVVNFAKNADGTHNTDRSDSCELLDKEGNLVKFMPLLRGNYASPLDMRFALQQGTPFVVHMGYLDLPTKLHRNAAFWKEHWAIEAGHDVKVPLTLKEFENIKSYPHNLRL